MAKKENIIVNSDLGLSRDDLETLIQQQLVHGMPAREVEGVAGTGLYFAGRTWGKVKRGVAKGIKGAIGSVLVVPKETEVAVIKRRNLARGGAVEYFVPGGLLTRVTEDELDRRIGVRPGTATLKIPFLEQAESIEAVALQPIGGKSQIRPELSGIAADMTIEVVGGASLADRREVEDTQGRRKRELVVDGNPIKLVRRWGNNVETASTVAINVAISQVFADEHFRQIARRLQTETEGIPTASITALVENSVAPALAVITREVTGLRVRRDTVAIDVEFPGSVQKFTDAELQARATLIEEGAAANVRIQETAGKAQAIINALGGPQGIALIADTLIGRRNQISE